MCQNFSLDVRILCFDDSHQIYNFSESILMLDRLDFKA